MFRQLSFLCFYFALALALVAIPTAKADQATQTATWIGEKACILADNSEADPAQLIMDHSQFECGAEAFYQPMNHLWMLFDTNDFQKLASDPAIRFNLSYNRDISFTLLDAEGGIETQKYTPQQLVEMAYVPNDVVFTFNASGPNKTQKILIGIKDVWDVTNWNDVYLVSQNQALDEHIEKALLFSVLIGLLITPLILNIVVYPVLKARFLPYHFGMLLGALIYGLSWSGSLNLGPITLTPIARSIINHYAIAIAFMFACLLTRELAGPQIIGRKFGRLLMLSGILPVLITVFLMLNAPAFSHYGSVLYHGMFMLPLITIIVTLSWFSLRGVRICQLQLLAWSPMFLYVAGRIIRGTGIVADIPFIDVALFPSLATEGLLTTSIVAYKIFILRRERDTALQKQLQLNTFARYDDLTGVMNRRAFREHFQQITQVTFPQNAFYSLILLDIDHFKAVNDQYGHTTGDDVLVEFATLLKNTCRNDDLCARYGGEEFCLLIKTKTREEASFCAERLRQTISTHTFAKVGSLSASIGLITLTDDDITPFESWFNAVDKALYVAKKNGRNRVQRSGWQPQYTSQADAAYAEGWQVKQT